MYEEENQNTSENQNTPENQNTSENPEMTGSQYRYSGPFYQDTEEQRTENRTTDYHNRLKQKTQEKELIEIFNIYQTPLITDTYALPEFFLFFF